ncbi:MAG: hypothetical protein Q9P01_17770 [Anaerolineae bacterium]|nr:hypothetical protein [Anaerolineae bacterium]
MVKSAAQAKLTSQPAATLSPQPVAATPAPPEPPKDPLEAQLEQELEAVHFDDMFADYNAERDAARARGENIDED